MTLYSLKACAKWQNQEQLITDDIFTYNNDINQTQKRFKK